MSKVLVTETNLQNIANAIRSKNGSSGTYKPAQMATAISALPSEAESVAKHFRQNITVYTEDYFEGVTNLRTYACYGNNSIVEVSIPSSVQVINTGAFSNCRSLKTVHLAEGVEFLSQNAFNYCSALTAITIPSTVSNIGTTALQCGSATNRCTFTFLRKTPPNIQRTSFSTSYIEKIIVPSGCGNAYKTATNWSKFADYIEEAEA